LVEDGATKATALSPGKILVLHANAARTHRLPAARLIVERK